MIDQFGGEFRYETFVNYALTGEASKFYGVAAPMKTATELSVFRLRLCPNDRDTGVEFQAEAGF